MPESPKMTQCDPILSIVIPTRNREHYAIASIRSILSIPSPRLELVVQDSSDSNALQKLIDSNISDSRLRYNYSKPPVNAVANFNKAVDLATGEYVCFIGDDDGVNPEIMQAAVWAKANDLDAVRPNLVANYFWPDIQAHAGLEGHAGKLFILNFTGDITFPAADIEARKCIHNAGLNYLDTHLPKIYHGIIRKKCLDEVQKLTGEYFKGLSPDIFGALAVSNFVTRMCAIDYPLTIGGTSFLSGAGDSAAGKHKGRLEDAPQLRDRSDYQWDELIPRFYSVQTIWAESAVVALRATNRRDLLKEFNLPLLYAQCLIFHFDFTRVIVSNMPRAFRSMGKGYLKGSTEFLFYAASILVKRAMNSLVYRIRARFSKSAHEIDGLANIEHAMNSLGAYLAENNRRFESLQGVHVDKN
jgi:glycosyltransferase involved in cell wall biosynthesis